jgi:hypothetical protein
MFSGARNNLFTGGTFNVYMHGATIGARPIEYSEVAILNYKPA